MSPRKIAIWPMPPCGASDAAVKSLEDQVRAAEAQVAVARANRKQLDVQQSDLAATRAQLVQARADKATADVHLGYMKIYAPLDGVVSVRAARQGEVLQAGEPIVTILDVDHLWVQADVEESYIDSVALNQHLKIRLPSGNTHRRHRIFQRRRKRFRDAARRQQDQARHQDVFHQGRGAQSGTPADVRHDRHRAAAASSLHSKLVAEDSLIRIRHERRWDAPFAANRKCHAVMEREWFLVAQAEACATGLLAGVVWRHEHGKQQRD